MSKHFVLMYQVGPDYVTRRQPFRADHLALAQAAVERGELLLGGALENAEDGAMLLFQGESAHIAEAFAEADPYVLNGVVSSWRVCQWLTVVGPGAASPVSNP